MNEFAQCKDAWEKLAQDDAFWAILTDQEKAGGRWDKAQFFQTGEDEIAIVAAYLEKLGRPISPNAVALDFGCGVGRLTQALGQRCATVHGVDISEAMIAQAKELNPRPERCHFHVNSVPDLSLFLNDTFDLIYTSIVLQHIPLRYVERYLSEFLRILKPNGTLIFQLPERFMEKDAPTLSRWQKIRGHLRLRTRMRKLLAPLKKMSAVHSGPPIMQMNSMSEDRIRKILAKDKARLLDVKLTNSTEPGFNGKLKFLDSEPVQGWVSKQYCVTK